MLIVIGLVLGVFLGVVLSVAAWATGRRPYLRVDIERHTTREVVHHVYRYSAYGDLEDRHSVVVDAGHEWPVMPTISAPPVLPARRRVGYSQQVKEIGR